MIIGERLRAMREEKQLSQGDIENAPACSGATSRASRTATPFQRSKHSKSWSEHWKFLFTNSFTTGRNPLRSPTFPKGTRQMTSPGEGRRKMRGHSGTSAGFSVESPTERSV